LFAVFPTTYSTSWFQRNTLAQHLRLISLSTKYTTQGHTSQEKNHVHLKTKTIAAGANNAFFRILRYI